MPRPASRNVDVLPADRNQTLQWAIAQADCRRRELGPARAAEELSRRSYLVGELLSLLMVLPLNDVERLVGKVLQAAGVRRQRERLRALGVDPDELFTCGE